MFTFVLLLGTFLLSPIRAATQNRCSPYPHVLLDHGSIRRVSTQKYSFRCYQGYFLASASTVRCFRGNWTTLKEPKCLKIQGDCEDPPAVDNAVVHGEDRHVGSIVKYICREGFTLVGHGELYCTRSRHWNRRAPTCMDQSEPLENVAERLKDSFVTQLESFSADTPQGRLLDKSSLLLGLELFLLVDRSSSVDPVHLEDAKRFLKFLLKRFYVRNGNDNKNGTRVAVLAFGTEVQTVFDVDDKNISNPVLAGIAIDSIQPNGGGTNMEGALTRVLLDVVKLRPDAKRALFLMTDGEPNIANPEITPQDLALELKNFHEFEIFTVGIGKGINTRLLNELASEPPLSHVFILEEYPNLNDVMKIIEDSKPPHRTFPMYLDLKINVSIAGWGRTSASRFTMAKVDDLRFEMRTTPVSLSEERECPVQRRGLTPLCAGRGSRSCYGLVGSPLMAEDSSTHFLHILGILADRTHCVQGQNQYVELTGYINWIHQVTSGCHLKHWSSSK